jgi:hypothetical protein
MPFLMQFHAENGSNPGRKEVCTMNTHDVVQTGSAHQDEQELRQHMQERMYMRHLLLQLWCGDVLLIYVAVVGTAQLSSQSWTPNKPMLSGSLGTHLYARFSVLQAHPGDGDVSDPSDAKQDTDAEVDADAPGEPANKMLFHPWPWLHK